MVVLVVVVNSCWALPFFKFMAWGSFVLLWLGGLFARFYYFFWGGVILAGVVGGKFYDLTLCQHVYPWQLTA